MSGTVLLTGANGSLGIGMVKYLLEQYPTLTPILTVRDDSDRDANTTELRQLLSHHPKTTAQIRKLDLSSLDDVALFAFTLQSEIGSDKLPKLRAIICNAMHWKLSGGPAFSKDGYELALAINHLAHFSLTLRLLSSMDPQNGRIIFLGSEAHWPQRGFSQKGLPTHIPDDLELLVHPSPDEKSQEMGRGFQRYGTSKLVVIMVMYELSRRLKKNPSTQSIHTLAIDPLGLIDSKTFHRPHIPRYIQIFASVATFLLPLLRLFMPNLASVHSAGKPVVDMAVKQGLSGQDLEGYFEGKKKVESSPDSRDEEVQRKLWGKSVEWARLGSGDSVLGL